MLSALYNQVDEEVHKLVILSNKCQKELESLLEVRMFEEQTQQVSFFLLYCFTSAFLDTDRQSPQIKVWFSSEGEKQLVPLESQTLSVAKIKEMRGSLEHFLEESVVSAAAPRPFSTYVFLRLNCPHPGSASRDMVCSW